MSHEVRPGYYLDADGNWQLERRKGGDRRDNEIPGTRQHERRMMFRRHVDREIYERDHKLMIEEALEEFADQHDGHL